MSEEATMDGGSQRVTVKDAIRRAKSILSDFLEGELYSNLGLEQVKYDERDDRWLITLGFNRPWDIEKETKGANFVYGVGTPSSISRQMRTYKTISLEGQTGEFIAMVD